MTINHLVEKIRNHKDNSIISIHNLILELGLNNEKLHEQPVEMSPYFGNGLKMWQYPNQLSKFANYISSFSVSSYLEIGCRFGGTFVFNSEILSKNNPKMKLYACDIIPKSDILKEYANIRDFEYIQEYSSLDSFKEKFRNNPIEFVFIDGDHSYAGVKNDFQIFENSADTKYIVLHDIVSDVCPGVKQMWQEIKENNRFDTVEFCDQYDSVEGNYLGIGLAIRK